MATNADIEKYHVQSGRMLRENNNYINQADYLHVTNGLAYAAFENRAGVFSITIDIEPQETVAINLFFDIKSVISQVLFPTNNLDAVLSEGLATGTYADIIAAKGLNLTETFTDLSQAQIVRHATITGDKLSSESVDNGVITDGDNPVNISFTNLTSETLSQPIGVKYFVINGETTLVLLQSNTQLESNTEMSTYG